MLVYPSFDPVIFSIGPIKIFWYGFMYLLGFMSGFLLGQKRAATPDSPLTKEQVADLGFWIMLGVVCGGRIGYMLIYNFDNWVQDPLSLFETWHGGMSFHGGAIGVALVLILYSWKHQKSLLSIGDFVAPLVPLGIAFGRIGNFLNGELWGRPTDVAWGMIFPHVDNLARHPSQLYESLCEGLLLFIITWVYSSKPRPAGSVSGVFLLSYGSIRFGLEFFREPDRNLGMIAFDWMTMGQILCLPMIILGSFLIWNAYKPVHDNIASVSL